MLNARNRIGTGIGSAIAIICTSMTLAAGPSSGNVLTDNAFESGTNPLQPFSRACGNPWIPGEWNAEAATLIVGSAAGISPHTSDGMLRVNSTGGFASQVTQVMDVTAHAALIDAGDAVVVYSAWINTSAAGVDGGLFIQAGIGQSCVGLITPAGGVFTTGVNQAGTSLPSDGDLTTWELVTCSLRLPAGTRFISIQLSGNNAQIPADGLFFDTASVAICHAPVPAPCPSDVNGDGVVNAGDLAAILGNWGFICP